MAVKKNPFDKQKPQRKRAHKFSSNILNNEPVSKKAGRTMASKTKYLSSSEKK